jgi:hypothetical protein
MPAMTCPECGYSLTGLPTKRCPECGNHFDPARVYDLRKLERSRRIDNGVTLAIVVCSALVLVWQLYAETVVVPRMVSQIGLIWSGPAAIAYATRVSLTS